jgi:ubiquinone/menaquinone biosynthesis C-methylase UbiE
MSEPSEFDLIIDLHLRNDRQGPGGDEETQRAIELGRLGQDRPLAVADIGCGTGASSLVLARSLDARITAVDFAEPFIDRLRERVDAAGLSGRIDAMVGRMEDLPFAEGQLDLIWSEGAIYNVGFESGLRSWRRFLRPHGVVAVSEITWTTAERPADVHEHWMREYPEIDTASAKLKIVEQAGYEPLGVFLIPGQCWEANYYAPIRAGFPDFLERHGHSGAARSVVAAEEAEMAFHRERGAWFSYAFYIARRVEPPMA